MNFGPYEQDILIYAFRYTLPRQTYAVSTVVDVILDNWDTLSDHDKNLYKQEILEYKETWGFSTIDSPDWDKILDKWKEHQEWDKRMEDD